MPDDDWVLDCYRPEDGGADGWVAGLICGSGGIGRFLGEESPVFESIKRAGEDLLRARAIVRDLVESGTTEKGEIPVSSADEVCAALSSFARSPSCRFYLAWIFDHSVVLECVKKRLPKSDEDFPGLDVHYNATVTYAFWTQFISMAYRDSGLRGDEKHSKEIIRSLQACLDARPGDTKVHVMFGNYLMMHGFSNDAKEQYEKALEQDEAICFNAHYSLANMLDTNTRDGDRTNLSALERMQRYATMKDVQAHLERYIELAPVGHWHVHRACILLIQVNVYVTARGSEKIQAVEKRHPGFCAKQVSLFERGVEALRIYTNCFGKEESDFRRIYKNAASMVATIQKELGLGNADAPPSLYICGNPTCTNEWWHHTLKNCAQCSSIAYCSKPCQVSHWKMHKKDCKGMKAEYDEQQKITRAKKTKVKKVKTDAQI